MVIDRHFVSRRKPDDLPDFCRGPLAVLAGEPLTAQNPRRTVSARVRDKPGRPSVGERRDKIALRKRTATPL